MSGASDLDALCGKACYLEETLDNILGQGINTCSGLYRTQIASAVQLIYPLGSQVQPASKHWRQPSGHVYLVGKYIHVRFHQECPSQTQKGLLRVISLARKCRL